MPERFGPFLDSKRPLHRHEGDMSDSFKGTAVRFRCVETGKRARVQKTLAFHRYKHGQIRTNPTVVRNIEKGALVRVLDRAEHQGLLVRACKIKRIDDKRAH